jgi:hypothetical protein
MKPEGWKYATHFWDYCTHCDRRMVRCGKCGNNSCNGGYGTLADGSQCDACPSAYDKQDRGEAA